MAATLLVLGGSGFVGPAVVQAGLERDFEVTTFHRGADPSTPPAVDIIQGDRLEPASLEPLRERRWDVVVDTGLRCRPVLDTVRDTWQWMSGLPGPPPLRQGLSPAGLSPEREREVLLR